MPAGVVRSCEGAGQSYVVRGAVHPLGVQLSGTALIYVWLLAWHHKKRRKFPYMSPCGLRRVAGLVWKLRVVVMHRQPAPWALGSSFLRMGQRETLPAPATLCPPGFHSPRCLRLTGACWVLVLFFVAVI